MKRITTTIAGVVFVTWAAAAAPSSSRVHEEFNPQSKLKTLTLEVSTHACQAPTSNDRNDADVRLIFNAFQSAAGSAEYVLVVDMRGGEFVHPGRHGTLETLTDSGHDELVPVDRIIKWSDHAWSGGREKREQIPFGADRALLEQVAETKVFQFRVNAADHVLERCTDAKELRGLRDLLGRAATL